MFFNISQNFHKQRLSKMLDISAKKKGLCALLLAAQHNLPLTFVAILPVKG
jgi:hypothetical protein